MTMPTDTSALRGTLADRAAGAAVERHAEDGSSPAAVVLRRAIESQGEAFRQVLPSHVDPDKFSRLVLTAVKSTPKLMECFATERGKTSILLAAMQAAAIGLEPNTPMQSCWLLPRSVKAGNNWVTECELSIGYKGYMVLARRSGVIDNIQAHIAYEHDDFTWSRGLERDEISLTPARGERGAAVYVYAVARFTDGSSAQFVVLTEADVYARRAMSESWKNERSHPYSPWTKWPDAMWRKSAVRELMKWLELSPEQADAVHRDEMPLALAGDGTISVVQPTTAQLEAADRDAAQAAAEAQREALEAGDAIDAGSEETGIPADADERSAQQLADLGIDPETGEVTPDPETLADDADIPHGRALMEARKIAKRLGATEPTELGQVKGSPIAAELAAWFQAQTSATATTPAEVIPPEAGDDALTDHTRKKLFAMASDVWEADDLRAKMLGLAAYCGTPGLESRTEISETLALAMVDVLDAMDTGGMALYLKASGDWDLRKKPAKPAAAVDGEPF